MSRMLILRIYCRNPSNVDFFLHDVYIYILNEAFKPEINLP